MNKHCMNCGAAISDGAKFCINCGTASGQVCCPACGGENSPQVSFCQHCAAPLKKAAEGKVSEPPKVDTPAPDPVVCAPEPSLVPSPVPAEGTEHVDPVCPHCGGKHCQPMNRSITKVHSTGPSLTNACCGMCLMGPVGLLCGLCGMGTRVDVKNETVWICQDCGKEHISQADAKEKWWMMALTASAITLFCALFFSAGLYGGKVAAGWMIAFVVVPLVWWLAIPGELSKELGYPLSEMLDRNDWLIVLVPLAILLVIVLWAGGPAFLEFVSET